LLKPLPLVGAWLLSNVGVPSDGLPGAPPGYGVPGWTWPG
jgi:hypothetical protein